MNKQVTKKTRLLGRPSCDRSQQFRDSTCHVDNPCLETLSRFKIYRDRIVRCVDFREWKFRVDLDFFYKFKVCFQLLLLWVVHEHLNGLVVIWEMHESIRQQAHEPNAPVRPAPGVPRPPLLRPILVAPHDTFLSTPSATLNHRRPTTWCQDGAPRPLPDGAGLLPRQQRLWTVYNLDAGDLAELGNGLCNSGKAFSLGCDV